MIYKGGKIEKLTASDASSFDDERKIKYHVTYPDGCKDGHGCTIKYVSTIKEGKAAINDSISAS